MSRSLVLSLAVLAYVILGSGLAYAQEKKDTEKKEAEQKAPEGKQTDSDGGGETGDTTEFLRSLSMGVGSMKLKTDEVKKAAVVGGVVRIDETSRNRNSFWLQTNWIYALKPGQKGLDWFPTTIRPGIWAGLELGADNKLASGIAGGLQISFIEAGKKTDNGTRKSLNLGYGWYRSSMQVLADGVETGKALPTGVESVGYKQIGVNGTMWMLSLNVTGF